MAHISWPSLLPIALNLHAARSTLAVGIPIEVLQGDRSSRAVLDSVVNFSKAQAPGPALRRDAVAGQEARASALEAYFGAVGRAVEEHHADSEVSPEAQALLTALADTLSRAMCGQCAGSAGVSHVCRFTETSGAADAAALAERGACLEPIRELFDFCVALCRSQYEQAGAAPLVQLELSTGIETPRNAAVDAGVYGATSERRARAAVREVKISLATEEPLRVNDYLAVLYVMFHECFVHGYSGIEVVVKESKAFHEGWMDSIAAQVLKADLSSEGGDPAHTAYRLREAFVERMDRMRSVRYDADRPKRHDDVIDWLIGVKALSTLQRLFRGQLAATTSASITDIAEKEVARLSMALNASCLSDIARKQFVRLINLHYSRTGATLQEKALEARPNIQVLIDQYLIDRDALKFAEGVVQAG